MYAETLPPESCHLTFVLLAGAAGVVSLKFVGEVAATPLILIAFPPPPPEAKLSIRTRLYARTGSMPINVKPRLGVCGVDDWI